MDLFCDLDNKFVVGFIGFLLMNFFNGVVEGGKVCVFVLDGEVFEILVGLFVDGSDVFVGLCF